MKRTGQRGGSRRTAYAACAGLTLAMVLVLGSVVPGWPQSQSGVNNSGPSRNSDPVGQAMRNEELGLVPDVQGPNPVIEERRLRALNIERQKRMVADTNKLLTLAKELNDEVASTNTGSFTVDQLRKIGEIEKLARSVRERMAAGVAEVPNVPSPPMLGFPINK